MGLPSFRDLEISPHIIEALEAKGITAPFPIQALVMADALKRRDILAQAPTGSGKTLAFSIPIIEQISDDANRPAAVVLVPTRELCSQVVQEIEPLLVGRKLKVAPVYGGTKLHEGAEKARDAHIVIATPGRLNDLLERGMIHLDHIKVLVLDEADRMLDMGFQPQVDRIVSHLPKDRHTMFFSATLEGKVGRVAKKYTHDAAQHEYRPPEDRRSMGKVEHKFLKVNRGTKIGVLAELIQQDGDLDGLTLVFVRTKRGADQLVKDLKREGVRCDAMHGDMTQAVRERTLSRFDKGELNVLIATDVAARGLDLDDITHVINFDCPDDPTDYVHRTGRTGRAGREGRATTLVQDEQQYAGSQIATTLDLEEQYKEAGLRIMAPRLAYASRGFRGAGAFPGMGGPKKPGFKR
jgi:superfamily II DNA/RNA helicase